MEVPRCQFRGRIQTHTKKPTGLQNESNPSPHMDTLTHDLKRRRANFKTIKPTTNKEWKIDRTPSPGCTARPNLFSFPSPPRYPPGRPSVTSRRTPQPINVRARSSDRSRGSSPIYLPVTLSSARLAVVVPCAGSDTEYTALVVSAQRPPSVALPRPRVRKPSTRLVRLLFFSVHFRPTTREFSTWSPSKLCSLLWCLPYVC